MNKTEIRSANLVLYWPDHTISKSRKRKNKRKEIRRIKKRNRLNGKSRERFFSIYGRFCRVCNTNKSLTIDHIIRTADGGTKQFSNLQILCEKHHIEKEKLYDKVKGWCKINNEDFNIRWMRVNRVQYGKTLFK